MEKPAIISAPAGGSKLASLKASHQPTPTPLPKYVVSPGTYVLRYLLQYDTWVNLDDLDALHFFSSYRFVIHTSTLFFLCFSQVVK